MLAISKKVGNDYVLVNSIGLMQVNQNISNREHFERDVRAIHELINPGRDVVPVYAKHYKITNTQAEGLLEFIMTQRGRRFSFSEFSRNCHNFVIATLSFLGIHDKDLINCILPPRNSSTRTTLKRDSVPKSLLEDKNTSSFTFYGQDKKTAKSEKDKLLTTWTWAEGIEIIDKIEYKVNVSYFKLIENVPNIESNDSKEKIRLKKAIHLLRDYQNGSLLAHPGRTYREVVQKFLNSFDLEQKNVNDLVTGLRQAIVNHHIEHGESAIARGSLNQRLLFIDFVLNTERLPGVKPFEFIKPANNPDAELLLYEIVHRDIDPFYSDTIGEHRRKKFNEVITENGGILEHSKKLYQQNKLPVADFLDVLKACREENIPVYTPSQLEDIIINLINNKIWNKEGGVFWKSLPEGIGQMRELSHFGLNKLIDIAEQREKSIKFSVLENTGLRSNFTSEFYTFAHFSKKFHTSSSDSRNFGFL